ncbi:aldehyde dehydrogenase [Stenotrophomonas ginsengisoli]|uniref:Aldehyde dehydrogenase n=1 Tax=Stenotrophomonas ginsengisoli TaxID=336566 RepID=A0A0R0DA26_9GAMM|nr:coniferyl aldehyde dehydrogenase [Stenotrophomonas ginsengisoli]KRG75394.1 aldehyde dehydrogenase [Stenotrophomonas ginsengisoli]
MTPDTDHPLAATLTQLRAAWQANKPGHAQRRADLKRLRAAFKAQLPQMTAAMQADFGQRAVAECRIADGMTTLAAIDYLLGRLRDWMRPTPVSAGWRLLPARAEIRHEPLGVIGVISPWNYPVNLALIPLATAIAAGNHVFLKPSENTPATSAWLAQLLASVFPADRVAVAQGDAAVGSAFAALPFDHLKFTGSTVVGRKVMAAAAANLTPLTLELGGKSPAIVCADYPIDKAAARLATGKWFNAGQTCIAPDYVLVEGGAARVQALADALATQVRARYGDDLAASPDYTRIINQRQYTRLVGHVGDARARGLVVRELASVPADAPAQRLIAPTLILQPGADATVMDEEIFGPLLPLIAVDSVAAAVAHINAGDRPLALYPFSNDRRRVEHLLQHTLAGGITVNDCLLHFAAEGLPFGGVGASGMGAYHGRAGFDAMTKALPILWQPRLTATDLLKPPYSRIARILDALVR